MRRTLSVWFPTFSTDLVVRRLRARHSAPASHPPPAPAQPPIILLTRAVAGRELLARCCARARAAGVTEGMDLSHARTLLPPRCGVHVEAHRPDVEAAALHALACAAIRFSPLVAPDGHDGLLIDATGTERVHRGEPRLLRGVARQMQRRGLCVRVAAAPTFACAWAVARFGRYDLSRVPPHREQEAVLTLPVAALNLDAVTVEGLGELGIVRVEHLIKLPRAAVVPRFGPRVLERLDQVLGRANESINPVRPTPPTRAQIIFDGPTDQWASIEAAAHRVLETLIGQLTTRERGVRRLHVELTRPYAVPECTEVTLSRPSRNPRHLWTLLRTRLERMNIGPGVEAVTLTASRTGRLRHTQPGLPAMAADTEQAAAAAWGELIDTLIGRLGPENIVRMEPCESHLPERAFRESSVMQPVRRAAGAGITPADRPTTLFATPEPAEALALSPDGPVISLGWRGERWRITTSLGPERISAEWWRWSAGGGVHDFPHTRRPRHGAVAISPPDRDYFAVQTETGRWLWACRQVGTGRWFVHGEWS